MLFKTEMAGKTKKAGRPPTPDSARSMMGHLGLKSNALAPTDSKLTSQYLVLDHMMAHYKNLSQVKAAVDTTPPKAWLISQKARDQARREAIKNEFKRRNKWLASHIMNRPPTRDSDRDRDEMLAMMENLSGFDDEVDAVDGEPNVSSSEATSKVNRLTSDDLNFVNQMVTDNTQSPSKYHSDKVMKSYIPATNSRPQQKKHRTEASSHLTPRGMATQPMRIQPPADIIDKQAHHFTEEKPFTPRMLKSKPEVQSRLRSFKYYNPPKRSNKGPKSSVVQRSGSMHGSLRGGSMLSRPETPFSDSVDLMNETLVSRDMNQNEKPSGVPPLDISLDADHMRWVKESIQRGWIKEQSRKAQLRASAHSRSDAGSDVASTRQPPVRQDTMSGTATRTLNISQNMTKEEELRYLEFLTDVTNDVLDRGIFTNRVLKQVFANHIEKKQHELKPEKMHAMLENLRRDLGIPSDPEDDGLGMNSVRAYSPDPVADSVKSYEGSSSHQQAMISSHARRKQTSTASDEQKGNLPHLRLSRNRPSSSGGEGKPPLPRPGSRGSWSRPGSAASNHASLHEVKEEAEESSITFTDDPSSSHGQADILKINHDNGDSQEQQQWNRNEKQPTDEYGEEKNANREIGDDKEYTLTEQYAKRIEDDEENTDNYDDDFHDDVDREHDDQATMRTEQDGFTMNHDSTETQHMPSTTEARLEPDGKNAGDEEVFEVKTETPKEPPKPTPRTRSTLSSSDFRETPRSTEHTSESVTVSELNYDDF